MTITATGFGGATANGANTNLNPGSLTSAAGDRVIVVYAWFASTTAVSQAAGTVTSTPAKTFTKDTDFFTGSMGLAVYSWVSDGTTLTQINVAPTVGTGFIGNTAGSTTKVAATGGTVTYDGTTKGTGTDATSPLAWSAGAAITGTQIGFIGAVIDNGVSGAFTTSTGYTMIQEQPDGSLSLTNHEAFKVGESGTPSLSVAYSAAITAAIELFVSFKEPASTATGSPTPPNLPRGVAPDWQWTQRYGNDAPTGSPQTVNGQVADLILSAVAGTVTAGNATVAAQVGTLTLTAIPGTVTGGPATITAQIATIILTPIVGTKVAGGVTITGQVASLTLTALAGTVTAGNATITAQVATLTLTALAGTVTGGATSLTAQVGILTLTGIPGAASIAGGSPQTVTAQVGALTLTAIAGTATGGPVSLTAQIATITLTPIVGVVTPGAVTKTAQVGTLALTAVPGTVSAVVTIQAQTGLLTLLARAGVVTAGPATLQAQIALLALTGVPGVGFVGTLVVVVGPVLYGQDPGVIRGRNPASVADPDPGVIRGRDTAAIYGQDPRPLGA